MRIRAQFFSLLVAALAATSLAGSACSEGTSEPNGASSGVPAGADASSDRSETGACCPPGESPGCCMAYGGARNGGECSMACDGMPVPTDPGWSLATDSVGCPVWTNPHDYLFRGGTRNPETKYCGGVSEPDAAGAETSDSGDGGE